MLRILKVGVASILLILSAVATKQNLAEARAKLYPDLTLSASDIRFSKENPQTNEEITIYITVHNIGEATAKDGEIFFYKGDPQKEGIEIGKAKILKEIPPGGTGSTSIRYKADKFAGIYKIYAMISPFVPFYEKDYKNNKAYRTITVSGISASRFTGVYSDYGLDENNDGLYDWLIIEVEVEITKAGRYCICGQLYDKDGKKTSGSPCQCDDLNLGKNKVNLDFYGMKLYRFKEEGPYRLGYITLEEMRPKGEKDIRHDTLEDAYTTAVYKYTDFQKGGKIRGIITDPEGNPFFFC